MKYLIVLFKNKERKKIIKKFKTLDRAKKFYDNSLEQSKQILFDKKVENGKFCEYEIGLIETEPSEFGNYFIKDDLGRQVKIEIDDPSFRVLNISKFRIEDFIYDIKDNKKLDLISFIRKYLQKEGIKLVSKLNNKIVVQNDDSFNIFSLKSELESKRFLTILEDYMLKNKRLDCIIVSDDSIQQKKYLYDLLNSKGISKSILYKKSTTFFTGK
jgi:hypothetical protein